MIRILAVDESTSVLGAFKFMLTHNRGYELTTTQDRDKAPEILKTQEIDIIIYDIPHGIRYDKLFNPYAIEDLKSLHLQYPNIPVIATSTEPAIRQQSEEFKSMGVRKCLDKTFTANELTKAIDEILAKK